VHPSRSKSCALWAIAATIILLSSGPPGPTAPSGVFRSGTHAEPISQLSDLASPRRSAWHGSVELDRCPANTAAVRACPLHLNAGPSDEYEWQNLTSVSARLPPTELAAASWDFSPTQDSLIYFGGCQIAPGPCPDNYTFSFSLSKWKNLSGSLSSAPPPEAGATFDWDPDLKGDVLTGGFGVDGRGSGQTWLFANGSWSNLTSAVGEAHATAFGAMGWDPNFPGLVYVGGCTTFDCTSVSDAAWYLTVPGDWQRFVGFGAVYGEAIAYDPTDGGLVSFGGGNVTTPSSNQTWAFVAGHWQNLTGNSSSCLSVCGIYPSARTFAAMTWDNSVDALLLFGGRNETTGTLLNDVWEFSGGEWENASYPGGGGPAPSDAVALPTFSGSLPPVLVPGLGDTSGDTFVWELTQVGNETRQFVAIDPERVPAGFASEAESHSGGPMLIAPSQGGLRKPR
jgi:hypothetical protein